MYCGSDRMRRREDFLHSAGAAHARANMPIMIHSSTDERATAILLERVPRGPVSVGALLAATAARTPGDTGGHTAA